MRTRFPLRIVAGMTKWDIPGTYAPQMQIIFLARMSRRWLTTIPKTIPIRIAVVSGIASEFRWGKRL